jgi:mono/diheme cytochrome c family protein
VTASDRPRKTSRVWSAVVAVSAAVTLAGLVGVFSSGAGAAGEDGEAVFAGMCQGCHSIGGGDGVGPDLAGLADRRERDWVERFILVPDEMIAEGDPIVKELLDQYGAPMPNLGVTAAQIGPLMAFLGFSEATEPTETEPTETQPATETEPTETQPSTEPEPAPPSGEVEEGKNLFTGADRFEEGGPSCLSCHSVAGVGALGGGQLGPDLTDVYDRYGGEQGLSAVLTTIAFPTMVPIYTRKQLTEREVSSLVAFLADAPEQQRPARAARKLVGYSVAVAAGMAVLGMGIWRRRLTGVRKQLVNRSKGK